MSESTKNNIDSQEFDNKKDIALLKEKYRYLLTIINLRLTNSKQALEIQAKEYERRLMILNHEAEQLKAMQAKYLPREVYETEYRNLNHKVDQLQKYIWMGVGGVAILEIILQFIK